VLSPELLFWLKYAPNRFSAWALPQAALGELPRTPDAVASSRKRGKGREGEETGEEG